MLSMNDGHAIPALGLGTFKIPDSQAAAIVRKGVDLGFRLVDTAEMYENERGVGEGLKGEDMVFLTTKLMNDRHGRDAALAAFDESLALLGRDSIDLFLIHWPRPSVGKFVETWKAFVELREQGRVKSIGVSNFLPEHIDAIADATGVMPALNQVELHPGFQQRQQRAYHEKHDIVTQSWSPLGRGEALRKDAIRLIADKHGRSAAQVVLRWHLQHGLSVIPKAGDPDHLSDNIAALDWSLDGDDMAKIDALDDADGRIGPHPQAM